MSNDKLLASLFNKYDCDKAAKHLYHTVYAPELEKYKDAEINFLEVGVFKGASLRAWLDFFPNATFYGIDVFTRVDPKDIDVLKNPRVKWIKADSTKLAVISTIKEQWPGVAFDVIIDDGPHTPRANADTFGNLVPFLKDTGVYFIEDVWPIDIMSQKDMKNAWVQNHSKDLNILEMNYFLNKVKGYTFERFDLRLVTNQPDSHIIKITK